jgi:hypothetical protein
MSPYPIYQKWPKSSLHNRRQIHLPQFLENNERSAATTETIDVSADLIPAAGQSANVHRLSPGHYHGKNVRKRVIDEIHFNYVAHDIVLNYVLDWQPSRCN